MKKITKILSAAVSLSMLFGTIGNSAVVSAKDSKNPNIEYYSTVLEDGSVRSEEYYKGQLRRIITYTNESYATALEEIGSNYAILVESDNADALQDKFADDYALTTWEDGRLCIRNKEMAEFDVAYYSDWTLDEAQSAVQALLQSGLVKTATLEGAYREYSGYVGPHFANEIYLYANRTLTDADFSWLDASDATYTIDNDFGILTITAKEEWYTEEGITDDGLNEMNNLRVELLQKSLQIDGVYGVEQQETPDRAAIFHGLTYVDQAVYTAQPTGDIDGDGAVTPNDVYKTLLYAAQVGAGLENVSFTESGDTETPQLYNAADTDVESFFLDNSGTAETAAFAAADINGDGKIDEQDVYRILKYCAEEGAGLSPSWDE